VRHMGEAANILMAWAKSGNYGHPLFSYLAICSRLGASASTTANSWPTIVLACGCNRRAPLPISAPYRNFSAGRSLVFGGIAWQRISL